MFSLLQPLFQQLEVRLLHMPRREALREVLLVLIADVANMRILNF